MDFNQLFSEAVYVQTLNVEIALAAAVYPAAAVIPVGNFNKFAFLIQCGALTSEITATVQQAQTPIGVLKDVEGTELVIPDTGDSLWYLIEVESNQLDINNGYAYVALEIAGAAGDDDFAAITFLGFGAVQPVTQGLDCGEIVTLAG